MRHSIYCMGTKREVPNEVVQHMPTENQGKARTMTGQDYLEYLSQELEAAREVVIAKGEKVRQKHEKYYNMKRRETHYEDGELVLVYKPLRKKDS